MEHSIQETISPKDHITTIFKDYEASARLLQTLTNLSNTVIETALSGQCKFLFEILQNADDAFDDESKYNDIKLQLVLLDDYFIIQHNGKVFNYYDVERICDYASQIEEVKANDLSKTGYKGLGFKSLFNLSDSIYIYSNGYSFRFDKTFWPDPEKKPWQVIPIWCDSLPLRERYTFDQPVNFIMKINDKQQLNIQLKELIDHPEVLLYLHRVKIVHLNQNGMEVTLERKVEKLGLFHKIIFLKNRCTFSTWLSRTYERDVPLQLKKCIQEVSQFIYPDKIKNAKEVVFTFTFCTSQEDILKIHGVCYSTLPTQLKLSLPYHVNSLFILNLDRTQFHENEWNEFLVYQIGYLQLSFLKDIAELPNFKNFVIDLLVRKINHSYSVFNKAFSKGFKEAKEHIAWLPGYKGHLLKLSEACVDKILFFKQNFKYIEDEQSEYVIDYGVHKQDLLDQSEASCFDYDTLFDIFHQKYYPQLTENSYMNFLSYLYENRQSFNFSDRCKLKTIPFLKSKDKTLISTTKALLEEEENPIPDFAKLNPVNNKYLPVSGTDSFKNWLVDLGAKRLKEPIQILRASVFQWIESDTLHFKMNMNNHKAVIEYLAKNFEQFTVAETNKLKKKLLILTKSNTFKIITSCCPPNAITLEELGDVMSDDEVIAPCYDLSSLKGFFSHLGISDKLEPIEVFRKCILVWIEKNKIRSKFTSENFKPIIEYLSAEYQKIYYLLSEKEKEQLGKLPILTCTQIFHQAKDCFFDIAIPDVKGFEDIIEKNILISIQNFNNDVCKFLLYIGVKKEILPNVVIKKSVLKWIQNRVVQSRINLNNHYGIVKYIAEHWSDLALLLKTEEKNTLKKLPVLTKNNNFRQVCTCFFQTEVEIPKLESIVSADELVSSEYYEIPKLELSTSSDNELKDYALKKERCTKIKKLLISLGACYLKFVNIYDKYYDHLTELESLTWFFSNLIEYWRSNTLNISKNKLLNDLKIKLQSSHLLSKSGKSYPATEFYSSMFLNIHKIDENAVPLLAFEDLPEDLEKWLGIKQEVELSCIMKLLAAIDKKKNLGEENTLLFFTFLLEQLHLKDKNEIKKYALKLLSNDNKLTVAKELYYFEKEDAVCYADSYYLKRIHGMTHDDTLALAKLCEVNLLPFNSEINYGEPPPIYDKTLKEFYLKKLSLIVFQESKEINETPGIVLKKLFSKINSFDLHKCQNILIKYPFGETVKRRYYFDYLKIYVTGNWEKVKTKIHEHIKEILELKSDISDILDLEFAEDITEWLGYQKDPERLLVIEEELNRLLSGQAIETDTNSIHTSVKQDIDVEQIETTTINQSNQSNSKSSCHDDLPFKQNTDSMPVEAITSENENIYVDDVEPNVDFTQVKAVMINDSVSSNVENISTNNSFKQDTGLGQVKTPIVDQYFDSENDSISNDDLLIKQYVSCGDLNTATINQHADLENIQDNISLLVKQDVDIGQIKIAAIDQSIESNSKSISTDDLSFKQDIDSMVVEAITITQSVSSETENINCNDLFKPNVDFTQVKTVTINESVSSIENISTNSSFKQDIGFGQVKTPIVNQSVDSGNYSINNDDLLNKKDESFEDVNSATVNRRVELKNVHDNMSPLKDVSSGIEKPTYDATFKQFYFQRLPVIVLQESKTQKCTPKEILKSLHKKISSIELYQCSDIHIQYPTSYIVDTNCFFDDLKIYVVGKWSDQKSKIHHYIKGKLGLSTDVDKERVSLEEDESEKLLQIEEDIKTFMATEKTLADKLQSTNGKEKPKDVELSENKEFVAGTFSCGNSDDSSDYKLTLSRPYYSVKYKDAKVLITFAEKTGFGEQYNPSSEHLDEDTININVKLTEKKQSTYYKNTAQKPLASENDSLPINIHVNPHRLLQDVTDDESHLKKLSEKYVFIFLQDYYKNKYSDGQINSEGGHFTLLWQSHTIEIIWLNDDGDKGLEYDLLLKKNEEVKQYIAVKSVNQAKSDLFNMIHSIFARKNKFAAENPEFNAEYCIYCIIYEDESSLLFTEEIANVNALYKLVSLKLPPI